jgi:hypothetical protein
VTDPRLVHFDSEVVDRRIVQRVGDERLAVAEADVEHTARVATEDRGEIERTFFSADPIPRQQLRQRAALRGRRATGTAHEAANAHMRCGRAGRSISSYDSVRGGAI